MAAACKRQALAFYLCKGEADPGLCMTSGLAKTIPLRSADLRRILRPNTFKNWKSALRSGILFASPEVMHRPRTNSPLHFNFGNLQQIGTGKQNASARRLHAAAMHERWPQVCLFKMTFQWLLTLCCVSTAKNLNFCKLDYTEFARSF